jgi:hypothetical protein
MMRHKTYLSIFIVIISSTDCQQFQDGQQQFNQQQQGQMNQQPPQQQQVKLRAHKCRTKYFTRPLNCESFIIILL